MRVQAKQKVGKKFENISMDKLKGTSFIDYCADEFDHVTLAMFEDDNDSPSLIISNRITDKEVYAERNLVYFYAEEFQRLLSNKDCPNIVLNVIEGTSFIEVKSLEPEKEE